MRKSKLVAFVFALFCLTVAGGWVGAATEVALPEEPVVEVKAPETMETETEEAKSMACAEDLESWFSSPFQEVVEPLSFCPGAFCTNDADCQGLCPQAISASCNGFLCQFDTGGGGGGGGGCSGCVASFCFDDADCQGHCPRAKFSICSGYQCVHSC